MFRTTVCGRFGSLTIRLKCWRANVSLDVQRVPPAFHIHAHFGAILVQYFGQILQDYSASEGASGPSPLPRHEPRQRPRSKAPTASDAVGA